MEDLNINSELKSTDIDKSRFAVLHPLRVRWNECDMHGIVFNVNYFLYYDVAMFEWQRAIGESLSEQIDFVTVHAECDYLHSAKFDDWLEIGVRCAAIGSKSINLETAVFRGRKLLSRGKLTYVRIAKGSSKSSPMSADLIDRILSIEKIAPLRA